jgi:hypothetical protein
MFGQKLRRYLSGGSLPYLRTPRQTVLPIFAVRSEALDAACGVEHLMSLSRRF